MSSVKLKMLGKLGKIMFLTAGKKLARGLDRISMVLLLLAGLNWGTVGIADFNAIMWVFITMPLVQHIIYTCFGLAAIWAIIRLFRKR
ncbi:MAG: DUF378 domain-containing protein [Parachlamydiales bacterium]